MPKKAGKVVLRAVSSTEVNRTFESPEEAAEMLGVDLGKLEAALDGELEPDEVIPHSALTELVEENVPGGDYMFDKVTLRRVA